MSHCPQCAALEREVRDLKHDNARLYSSLTGECNARIAAQDAYKRAERRIMLAITDWLKGHARTARLKHFRNVASELAFQVEYELMPKWCSGFQNEGLPSNQDAKAEPR